MKFTTTFLAVASLATSVFAQGNMTNMTMGGSGSSNYTMGLVAALSSANLTTLAGVLGAYPQLAEGLQQGNFTVFGPSNEAFNNLLNGRSLSDLNMTMVQQILEYHIAPGTYPQSALTTGTNHTIIPTLLKEPLLGNNMTAPLVISFGVDGKPRIREVATNVTVGGNATYQNLLVHVVDSVLQAPLNITATVQAAGLSALGGALSSVSPELPMMLEMTPRLTIFAPTDAAFQNISSTLATLNTSTIMTVLENHIINGTVVYSTEIKENTTAVSAAGETFSFKMMNGTLMVMSGQAMAEVVRTDIPIQNGVVHLISNVLANPMSNPEAAASAESSYAAAASTMKPSNGPIGGAAAATAAPTSDKKGAANKNMMIAGSTLLAAAAGVAVIAL